MGTFSEDVVVERVEDGRYRMELDHSWDIYQPQGGIIAAIGLRAAQAEMADTQHRLRSFSCVFAGQVSAGVIDIEVEVLRHGRSASQVRASVRNEGTASGTSILAVFGSTRSGPSFVELSPPKVPAPQDCRSYREPPPAGVEVFEPSQFWSRVEGRAAMGHAPWEDYEPTTSEVATWLRFDDPPRLPDGTLDPLGVVTLADRMPGCVGERIGHEGPRWFAPSADLTVHLLEPLRSEWLLAHDRARWADDGWASAESTLWDEDGTLVGHASQMMIFTYV